MARERGFGGVDVRGSVTEDAVWASRVDVVSHCLGMDGLEYSLSIAWGDVSVGCPCCQSVRESRLEGLDAAVASWTGGEGSKRMRGVVLVEGSREELGAEH